MRSKLRSALWTIIAAVAVSYPAGAQAVDILIQSTTSVENSGLLSRILPAFERRTGLRAAVVAVGSGQAIENLRRCNGDFLLSHAPALEKAFVAEGFGETRTPLMYNDFVFTGPENDPAGIGNASSVNEVLRALRHARFISRGDNSGTHSREKALWRQSGASLPSGYLETGSGMGQTINIAVQKNAYTFSDRATWTAFAYKLGHRILFADPDTLANQYAIIVVSPKRCAGAGERAALALKNWLLGAEGQAAIADFTIAGQQVFFPGESAARY